MLDATEDDIRPQKGNRGIETTNTPNHRRSATVGVRLNYIALLWLAGAAAMAIPPEPPASAANQQSCVYAGSSPLAKAPGDVQRGRT